MAELEEDTHDNLAASDTLEQSEDVRRIKEEWTRLQVEADSRRGRDEASGDNEKQNGKKPPSRLPSLDSMVDRIPSIPSMEISTGLGKKLPELGSVGHRLGIMGDAKDLEPQIVVPEKTTYTFGEDTPTQTDIKWSPPGNASLFKSLVYDIEVDGGQGWSPLTDNRLPILRAYFTSSKLLLGRFSKMQEAEPVAVRLRIRATGTIKTNASEETISGPWSEEIWMSMEGSCVISNTAV